MALEWIKSLLKGAIGWTSATLLALVFPLVVPCMSVLRFISDALKSPKKIRGNVVIVTGASSGIGSFIALEYAKHGARLVLVARRENRLREVAEECLDLGALDAAVCPADITKEEDCRRVVEYTLARFGRVDVLVNNAGAAGSGLFEDLDPDDIKRTMELDFWGTVVLTKLALEHLRRTKGSLVVTASVGAYVPYPRQAIYNAAKAAVVQFFDTLRTEPVGSWISITIVMPGFVLSELTRQAEVKQHIPWWWPMLPTEEAAKAVVEASIKRKHYVIIPGWYLTWLPYRAFAYELMEWFPRLFLLGKPPTKRIGTVCNALLGEQLANKMFRMLAQLAGVEV